MHKEFRVRVSIVIVILCCSAALARSQDISEAPAGTRSLGPLPFQLILPREHLLGDWYGTRTWLEERGIFRDGKLAPEARPALLGNIARALA